MVWDNLRKQLRQLTGIGNTVTRRKRRSLRLEVLGKRELLASDLGAISGIAFVDEANNESLSPADPRLENVQVQLFRDTNNNGVFDSGTDTLVGTDFTRSAPDPNPGLFRFDGLSPGDYFLVQQPSGTLTAPDPVLVTVVNDAGERGALIDDYSEGPGTLVVDNVTTNQSQTYLAPSFPSSVLGGERDVEIINTSGLGTLTYNVNTTAELLSFGSAGDATGSMLLQYDGTDGTITLDPTGLGGVALAGGVGQPVEPNSGIEVLLRAESGGDNVVITIYTSPTLFSQTTAPLPPDATNLQSSFIPFSSFVTGAGAAGPADFNNVGAIEAFVELAANNDVFISIVESIVPEVVRDGTDLRNIQPVTLGGELFIDNGTGAEQNNGLREPSEALEANPVNVQLFRANQDPAADTPIATTTTTAGSYRFPGLDPGDYFVVIPQSNFANGSPLFGFANSTGNDPAPDPNLNQNNVDKGTLVAGVGIVSGSITLVSNGEPIDDDDTDPNTNTTMDFGFFPQIDLSISKTVNVAASDIRPDGEVVFDIAVLNDAPDGIDIITATNALFSDTLPAGLTFVEFRNLPASAGPPTVNGQTASVNLGSLTPDQAAVTFQIVAAIDAAQIDPVTNTASVVTADQVDVNPANNTDPELVELESADLAITKLADTETVTAGNEFAYTITVSNAIGPDDATGVVVTDTLPEGVTLVSGNVDGDPDQVNYNAATRTITAVIGDLANSATPAVVNLIVLVAPDAASPLSNTATVTSTSFDPDEDNNSSTEETVVERAVDVGITKAVQAGDEVVAGGTFTYEFTVTNTLGPSVARNVQVTDALNADLTFVSFDAGTSGVTRVAGDDQDLTFDVGTMAPGEIKTFSIEVSLAASATGTIDNVANVTTTDNDTNVDNDSSTTSDPITRDIDLIIEKSVAIIGVTDGRTTAIPGQDRLIYTITVQHDPASRSDAQNVVVTDTLPAGLLGDTITVAGFDAGQGDASSFNATNQVATVTFGNLAVGETRSFTITTTIIDEAATADLLNTARLTDPADGEITATATTPLAPDFDVTVTKTVDNASPSPGTNIVYSVEIENEGPSTAPGVILSDAIPDGLTFVSGTLNGQAGTSDGTTITFPAITLDSGATSTATLTFTVDATAAGTIENTARVPDLSAVGENDVTNNSGSVNINVVPVAELTVAKQVSSNLAKAGDSLTYTITVTNEGISVAEGVQAIDTLPAGVTFISGTGPNGEALAANNGVVTVNAGTLDTDESASFTIIATVNAGVTAAQTNSVTVSTTTNEPNTGNNTAEATTEIDPARSTIDGFVFIDANLNNQFDPGESGVSGVEIALTGTDAFGNAVNLVDTTDATGRYAFDNLFAGTYNVQRTDRPSNLRDGGEQVGTGATATIDAVDNAFTNLGLGRDADAEDFNFGLFDAPISKRNFLAST